MQTLIKVLLVLIFLVFPIVTTTQAEETIAESPEDIADRLQTRYDKIKSLSFNFIQNTSGDMTGRPRRGTGKAAFAKLKDRSYMRWDYTSPDKQVLFSDGELFSMYFDKLKQMIVTQADTLDANLTYSFFTGQGILTRDFLLHPADADFLSENNAEYKVVKLIPKTAQSQVQDIHLWVTPESLIRRINIRDHFGTITILNLSDIKVDTLVDKPAEELLYFFSFVPPAGTEIIRQ